MRYWPRSHVKNQSKLRQIAKVRQIPIHGIKSNTLPQISRGLKRILGIDDPMNQEGADSAFICPQAAAMTRSKL
ncbi:MAG UNVERIFIED_CONTAM: hypothetical protein LVR29_26180 [Microcystis novacekii LVE1205-3]|jgi:hypothetical protein